MQQLTLWDEQPAQEPQGIPIVPGLVVIRSTHWADGDTRPEKLDRLALLMLDEIYPMRDTAGTLHFFRVISTGVVDNLVKMGCEYMCTAKEFYGGKDTDLLPEDEDEEYD